MRIGFTQGIVIYPYTGVSQLFLAASGGFVSLGTTAGRTDVAFSYGENTYLLTEASSVPNAWGPYANGVDTWLYWDLDIQTAVRTFGFTTLAPLYGPIFPVSPSPDQHFFNTTEKIMYVYEGGGWREAIRVFAAMVNTSTFTPLGIGFPATPFAGTQVGLTGSYVAGRIIVDNTGTPIRKSDGSFFTSEDEFFINGSPANTLRFEANVINATAQENIATYQVVAYTGFDQVSLASYNQLQTTAIAMSVQNLGIGQVGTIVTQGTVVNPAWNWTVAGAPLWVDDTGELTEIDLHTTDVVGHPIAKPPIGRVLSPTSVFFDQGLGGAGPAGPAGPDGNVASATDIIPGIVKLSLPPVVIPTSGYQILSVSGVPVGTVQPGLTDADYDFDINIDGSGVITYTITTVGNPDYDTIATLMDIELDPFASVVFTAGAFVITSASTGFSSTILVSRPTDGSNTDLFVAIETAATVIIASTLPVDGDASPIAVGDNDPRMTDDRAPLAHEQAATTITFTPYGSLTGPYTQDALQQLEDEKLSTDGGTLTGFLTLASNPINPLHAATKLYVDSLSLISLTDVTLLGPPSVGDMLFYDGGVWTNQQNTFLNLVDTPAAYTGAALQSVRVNVGETGLEFFTPASPSFLTLTDTPASYAGQAGLFVRVNVGETGLEFTAGGGGGASAPDTQVLYGAGGGTTTSSSSTFTYDVTTGAFIVNPGTVTGGASDIQIRAAQGTGPLESGGWVIVNAGLGGTVTGNGGYVTITAGNGNGSGSRIGGNVEITAGDGNFIDGIGRGGGNVTVQTGNTTDGNAGDFEITTGSASNVGNGGNVTITSGAGNPTDGIGGIITIQTGAGFNSANDGYLDLVLTNGLRVNSSAGTTGQVLQSQGSNLPPIWAASGGGGGAFPDFEIVFGDGGTGSQSSSDFTFDNISFGGESDLALTSPDITYFQAFGSNYSEIYIATDTVSYDMYLDSGAGELYTTANAPTWYITNYGTSTGFSFLVTGTVTTGLGGSFQISGDQSTLFVGGQEFFIFGSTGNNGPWTTASSSFGGGLTTIVVTGTILSAVADGTIFTSTPDPSTTLITDRNSNNAIEITQNDSTSETQMGFFGATPIAIPDVSGARNDPEQALANLLTALADLGLITDSTTAS